MKQETKLHGSTRCMTPRGHSQGQGIPYLMEASRFNARHQLAVRKVLAVQLLALGDTAAAAVTPVSFAVSGICSCRRSLLLVVSR